MDAPIPIPALGIGQILSSSTRTCIHETTPIPHNQYHVVKSSRSAQTKKKAMNHHDVEFNVFADAYPLIGCVVIIGERLAVLNIIRY